MNDTKKPRIPTDLVAMAVFTVLGVSMVWNTAGAIHRNYELQQQVNELEAEIALLEVENQNLIYSIEYYNTDTFLELEAREKFNKAKPGEKLALIPKDLTIKTETNSTPDQAREQAQFKSNFSAWMEFLFGKID